MDSYLDIAASVLKEVRRPLGARQILKTAYQLSIVPRNLFGRTQHKTLQARIAEDIKNERSKSMFMRTERGRFFLRSFLSDPTIPSGYKREYPARPRADQLRNFDVLCFPKSEDFDACESLLDKHLLDTTPMFNRRLSEVAKDSNYIFLRTFVITAKSNEIVVRRSANNCGQFGGNAILGSMGFVTSEDRNLFSGDVHGYEESSIRTISEQFALNSGDIGLVRRSRLIRLLALISSPDPISDNSIAAVFVCNCPKQFDPISRYVGGGSLYWHPILSGFNNLDALDPWSRKLWNLGVFDSAELPRL